MSMEEKKYTVYGLRTPDNMYYVGVTSQNVIKRWNNGSGYDKGIMGAKVKEIGWSAFEKVVFMSELSREDALDVEDMLICLYQSLGCSLNQFRSGHIFINNKKNYKKELLKRNKDYFERYCDYRQRYNEEHKDEIKLRNRKYYEEHIDEIKEQQKQYYEENKGKCKEYAKSKRSTPEGKIYNRVTSFNRYHPDRITESPLEARDNYLKYHIIPQYIKHDDLE